MERLIIAALLALASAHALAVTFPNGDYCSVRGKNGQKIVCTNKNASRWWTPYIQRTTGGLNTYTLSHLSPSPDGKYLYFDVPGGAVEDSVEKLNMKTQKATNFIAGNLVCVVLGGQFKGDLVIGEHHYYLNEGSYNAMYLISPAGKTIGRVRPPQAGHCATLGEHD